ncbi:MAG: hypothetical protein KA319_13200, partial [Ferruginibacter sp.]|nr:hypothetical protein [Ferruginibacter sp.]
MKKRKIIIYISLVIAVILSIAAIYAYKEYNRKQVDVTDVTPNYTISYATIIGEFTSNEKIASAKYLDKVIELEAPIKSIDKDEKGYYTLVLGDSLSTSSIRCSMDSAHNTDAAKFIIGNIIKAKGICTGFNADEMLGSDVILNRCT